MAVRCLPLAPVPVVPHGLEMPGAALAQDGAFTRSQARAEGWTDRRQRRLLHIGLWVVLAGPVLTHRDVAVTAWQRARAVQLTAGLVASHATAGRLWQLEVPPGLHGIGRLGRRIAPFPTHRLTLTATDRIEVRGLVVTSPLRTVTDLICALDEDDGVSLVTDAFRRGLLCHDDLRQAARRARGRHGAGKARQLAHTCRHEPHSPLEWRFHALTDAVGPGWVFNVEVADSHGLVGRVDALHEASRTIVELDGRDYHGVERFQSDRTRDQRLTALGHAVLRFTWQDVHDRPMDVIERLRRTIARRRPA